jgi:hypothetical protein
MIPGYQSDLVIEWTTGRLMSGSLVTLRRRRDRRSANPHRSDSLGLVHITPEMRPLHPKNFISPPKPRGLLPGESSFLSSLCSGFGLLLTFGNALAGRARRDSCVGDGD